MPPIFDEIRRLGPVSDEEMAAVFNLGIGMVVVVAADGADQTVSALRRRDIGAIPIGRVGGGERGVELVGELQWARVQPTEVTTG